MTKRCCIEKKQNQKIPILKICLNFKNVSINLLYAMSGM
jgi:hypothetical protein